MACKPIKHSLNLQLACGQFGVPSSLPSARTAVDGVCVHWECPTTSKELHLLWWIVIVPLARRDCVFLNRSCATDLLASPCSNRTFLHTKMQGLVKATMQSHWDWQWFHGQLRLAFVLARPSISMFHKPQHPGEPIHRAQHSRSVPRTGTATTH